MIYIRQIDDKSTAEQAGLCSEILLITKVGVYADYL